LQYNCGMDTVREDAPFHHYTAKHRLVAWVSMHLFDKITYTVQHGLLKGMKRKGGLGWVPSMFSSTTVTAEHRFWSELDLSGMTVYDVGAFHGLVTLLFASRAKWVVSFEPNTRNYTRLMENLKLNHVTNCEVRKVGVGSRSETRKMAGRALTPGGASIDGEAVAQLMRSGEGVVFEEISITTLDDVVFETGAAPPDFIKIDIEGWEIEALRGARKTLEVYKPTLFLEMHGQTIREKKRKVAEVVAFLWDVNYRLIKHIETGTAITPANADVAMQGHLYCGRPE